MFEAAELGCKVSKKDFEAQLPDLRAQLLQVQLDLRKANVPVIVIISGADGAGKGEVVNRLYNWFDPRGLETHVFGPESDEEQDRPAYWRFWRALPARGRIGIFFGSWYTGPIIHRVYGESSKSIFEEALNRITFFEHALVKDGALIMKFWLHLGKKTQRKRLKSLEVDPKTSWRVAPLDWKHYKLYDKFVRVCERAIRRTDSGLAPWFVVEATDKHYCELVIGQTLLDTMRRALTIQEEDSAGKKTLARASLSSLQSRLEAPITVLSKIDLNRSMTEKVYEKKLAKLQARLSHLVRTAWEKKRSSVVVFEGWDAGGKGGNIRRMTSAMDPRQYSVIPIAAPTDEERAHHYLWRFWRHIPRAGHVRIFDRSWYGRVLVERVEGFACEDEWMRSYLEINDFEQQLVDFGIVVVKFWLHIDKAEQLRRFLERKKLVYKRYKITDEDWRNRDKWDAYESAVNEMVIRTNTQIAPWTIVPGNDKRSARIQTIETFCRSLEAVL